MAVYTVHERDTELIKSGHGFTKFLHQSKGEGEPTIMIRHWGPETDRPVHSHPFNEMFYVLEGEVFFGDQICGPGSCIFIDKNTEYGPTQVSKEATVLRYAEGRSK